MVPHSSLASAEEYAYIDGGQETASPQDNSLSSSSRLSSMSGSTLTTSASVDSADSVSTSSVSRPYRFSTASSSPTESEASLHTVSSHFDEEIEHVDPFMFGYPTPTVQSHPDQFPSYDKHEPDEEASISPRTASRPSIHIRTRSLGTLGSYHSRSHSAAMTPPPQTPLPPIPATAPARAEMPSLLSLLIADNSQRADGELYGSLERSETLLTDISEESGNSGTRAQLRSFLSLDSSSTTSEPALSADEPELSDDEANEGDQGEEVNHGIFTKSAFSVSSLLDKDKGTSYRRRKLSKPCDKRHKKSFSSLGLSRMPSFRRGTSNESATTVDSTDAIRTPDGPASPYFERKHKKGPSWTRLRDKLKKEVFPDSFDM